MLLPMLAVADDTLCEKDVVNLFAQMAVALNSRDAATIGQFFSYRVAPDATLKKKSILLTPQDLQNPKSIENISWSKPQYIAYLQKITGLDAAYHFEYSFDSFQLLPDGYTAYAGLSIKEVSSVAKHGGNNIIASNCNYTILQGSDGPVIGAANCIEKIIIY